MKLKNSITRRAFITLVGVVISGLLNAQNTWVLNTQDTHLTIAVRSNNLYIDTLLNPAQNWNATASDVPLLNTVTVGATPYTPNWIFQEATVTTLANEKLVVLRFTSASPALELKSYWSAKSGPGPVENWITVQNETGSGVTYSSSTAAASLKIKANGNVTLQRYEKTNVGQGKVFTDIIGANANFRYSQRYNP